MLACSKQGDKQAPCLIGKLHFEHCMSAFASATLYARQVQQQSQQAVD